ncbi:MAG: cytochrome b [Hydrogenophaga sp.]|uniref:cytochrome b n=1 Tax=Hydrogenophaga sp. TaxID=1904254 RepID=UPI002AB8D65F|nr:cytochrome b [Hydrogenophaga sp.]MDZ4187588.1 cytochrome b [Hydrogenophaga sp.]
MKLYYDRMAVSLHWLLAVAWVGLFAMGLYMSDLSFSPQQLKLYNWHKWAGMCVLALSVFRVVWRMTHPAPPLPNLAATPKWQRWAHSATHLVMYALFFAIPLLGWAYSSAAGFPIVWWGLWPLPDWVPVNSELADGLKLLHGLAAKALALLVVLHVVAALKHHSIDRDGLLRRMTWRGQ